jgi:hypothetical protein
VGTAGVEFDDRKLALLPIAHVHLAEHGTGT